jgi:hypothetical protein
MSEREKQVLQTLEKAIPNMTEMEMAQLLGYGEGLAAREDRADEKAEATA